MSYHNVTMILLPDDSDESRLFWEIGTQWSKHTPASTSVAYTQKSEGYKIIRWASNDNVIPKDIMDGIAWSHKGAMDKARGEQTHAAIERYIQTQAHRTPEQIAEEEYEMRAAFGKGAKVVNVFTRKETQL